MLEQSLENILGREDRAANDSELVSTPVRVVPLTPGRIHPEVKAPKHLQRRFCLTSQMHQDCERVYSFAFRLSSQLGITSRSPNQVSETKKFRI